MCNRLGCVGTLKSLKLSTLAAPATSRIIEVLPPITLVGDKGQSYDLKDVNVIDRWPLNLSDLPKQKDIRKFKHLQFIDLKDRPNDIGLLLGNNEPELVKPLEVVSGSEGEPYAVKYSLGWSICGPLFGSNSSKNVNSKISCHEVNVESLSSIEESLDRFYRQDFEDPNFDSKGLSQMDKLWFSKVESSMYC